MTEFVCSLNGSAFRNCSSPYSTGPLADRKHTFSVKGKDRLGQLSSAFNYSWTVDTKINTPTFTKTPSKISNEVDASFEIGNLDSDIACLLYTSPSPRDQRGSRMPSSA